MQGLPIRRNGIPYRGWTACWIVAQLSAIASAQPLVPLGDNVNDPALPSWVRLSDVHIDGQLAYLWQNTPDEHVIHVVGDFSLELGGHRLSSEQGVIWMTTRTTGDREYHSLDVFLLRDASIVEPAGTITDGPVLFATLNSTGDVFVTADRKAFASSAETTVYRNAADVRTRLYAGQVQPVDDGPTRLVFPSPKMEAPIQREIRFSADETSFSQLDDGRRIITCIGNVNLFRGAALSEDVLELQADAAVIFLRSDQDADHGDVPLLKTGADQSDAPEAVGVQAVYLEGDIRLANGDRRVRASRLYYDLVNNRALMLQAVVFGRIPERDIPVYVRAEQIRQLSTNTFSADDVKLTTSEFHTPHYFLGARHLELTDRTPRNLDGRPAGPTRLDYRTEGLSFHLYDVPLAFWPASTGSVRLGDSPFRGISVGSNDDFGVSVETQWDACNLLSFETPVGTTADLNIDYFEKRGPAIGLKLDYEKDDYFGLYRGYFIDDRGKDNLGRFRDNTPDTNSRGRTTWRHRHYLPDDWELTLEMSYLSDRAFLEEFFESEFDEDKDQENVFYLVKRGRHWAFSALAQWRFNDFLTQTERLPDFALRAIGEPVGSIGSWFSENRAGFVRYRAAEQEWQLLLRRGPLGPSSGSVARADSRQELNLPLDLGPVRLVPFATVRGTAWDDSVRGGGLTRGLAVYGLRSSMYLSRTFPQIRSEFWDLNGIRHIIKPQLVAWAAHSNIDPDELFPFDEGIETVGDFDGVAVGLRQRWQTKRGPADAQRVVDWITLDVELGLFNDAPGDAVTNGFVSFTRPENSIARNYINTQLIWRLNDTTTLLSESNYDINDGEMDIFNVSLAVDRTPRFSYLLGYRFIEETDSNLLGLGMNYRIDEKHTVAFREEFDLERGDTLDFTVGYIRKFPRWYVAVAFELDEAENNAGVSISIWPEGLPRATLGSRRFQSLATTTAMQRY